MPVNAAQWRHAGAGAALRFGVVCCASHQVQRIVAQMFPKLNQLLLRDHGVLVSIQDFKHGVRRAVDCLLEPAAAAVGEPCG